MASRSRVSTTPTTPAVAFVLPSLNGGGAERAALNLHHYSSLDTRLIVERAAGDLLADPMALDAISLDLPVRAGRTARVARLARSLRQLQPSVVVAVLSPWTVGLAARSSKSHVVYWLQNPSYFMPGIERDNQTPGGRLGLRTLARLADAIAGAAPGLTDEWAKAGVPASKLAVLPNGIELPLEPLRSQSHRDSQILRLLTIGRLAPQKRHDLLIRALAQIRTHRPAELTVLGRGNCESELRALAESLGVADYVHFAGFVSEPSRYLASTDIFVLGSDFEGFGNVIVEALGYGLPVVCTDAPYGPRFIAGDCPAVRLVQPRDPSAIADTVLSVAEQGCGKWIADARARAAEFSVQRVCSHFDLLVEQMICEGQLPVWQDSSSSRT
jgi:glycosyltransferase involved in cell wall biosynthesis